MPLRISRRTVITAATGAVATGVLAPAILRADNRPHIATASLATGFSVIVNEYMSAKRFDLANGVDLSTTRSYVSVGNYLTDFAAGTFELAVAGWDSCVDLYSRGFPVQFVCLLATANLINIVSAPNGPSNVKELRGKSIAAVRASGTYQIAKAVLKEFADLELEKDIEVQNVPNPAQVITMIMAGNASAGLAWEPNVSAGIDRMSGLKAIYNFGEAYQEKTGQDMPYFGIAALRPMLARHPGVGERIAVSYVACIEGIRKNPEEALALAAPKLKLAPAVLQAGYDAGRLEFLSGSMKDPEKRKLVADAISFMHSAVGSDAKIGEDFYLT